MLFYIKIAVGRVMAVRRANRERLGTRWLCETVRTANSFNLTPRYRLGMTEPGQEHIYEFEISGGWAIFGEKRLSPFDIVDTLQGTQAKLYLHDLEGRHRNRQQLDLIQDLSLEIGIWYDGGIRTAEGVIDPLVAGAEMVALDPTYMSDMVEFEHVMRLTSSVILDLLSEHEDHVPDYNRRLSAGKGLDSILRLGYVNFLIGPAELGEFEALAAGDHAGIGVWLRTEEPAERSAGIPRNFRINGVVRSIEGLVTEDGQ